MTVAGVSRERGPAGEGIADRRRRIGLARELCECGFEPGAQAVEQRLCPRLADRVPDLWRAASDLSFDSVERGDALDGFRCGGRRVGDMDLVELAPRVGLLFSGASFNPLP